MQKISHQVWSHRSLSTRTTYRIAAVREDEALEITSFPSLVKAVSIISFKNPELSLFFRGQADDYRLRFNQTSLRPSIYRNWESGKSRKRLMKKRFDDLKTCRWKLFLLYRFEQARE